MHRRRLLKTAGIAAASTIAAPAVLRAQSPEIKWRCASSFPKTLDVLYGTAEEIGRRVAAATDNKFQIRVSAGGELVPGLQVLDAVQNETVECGHSASYYYVGKDPTFAFDTAIPFGLNARAHNAWMYAGGGFDLMRALFKDYTIVQFPAGNTGAQMGGWFRKELKSVDDLRGLKIRIAGFAGQVLARLGAVPQQIGGAGLYPALEKGTIDAAEFVGPYDDDKLGLVKVAPYYYYPGFWEPGAQLSFYVNAKQWESLPPQYQAAIDSACAAANTLMLAKYDAESIGVAAAGRSRGRSQAVPARSHAGGLQSVGRGHRRNGGGERHVQEGSRKLVEVSGGGRSLVPRRRKHHGQLPLRASRGEKMTGVAPCGERHEARLAG